MTLMVSTMESVAEGRGGLELGPLALVQRVAKYLVASWYAPRSAAALAVAMSSIASSRTRSRSTSADRSASAVCSGAPRHHHVLWDGRKPWRRGPPAPRR